LHSGKSMEGACLLIMRCPVYKGRESHLGSCVELGNLFGDAKRKGATHGRDWPSSATRFDSVLCGFSSAAAESAER
jgi:hypothetical protein